MAPSVLAAGLRAAASAVEGDSRVERVGRFALHLPGGAVDGVHIRQSVEPGCVDVDLCDGAGAVVAQVLAVQLCGASP